MKQLKKFPVILGILGMFVLFAGALDDYLFRINKSFELYGAVFREVASNYVIDVDPEELVRNAIEGMLSTLDPYTVFYDESETDDIDVITSGLYTGLGISVSLRDSMLTVTGINEGFSAQRYGLRVGDRLYQIDSTVVLRLSTEELRKYTRGKAGSIVNLKILRDGLDDTLDIKLPREQIKLKNVSYSGMIADTVGYIKLEGFTKNSAEEVKLALYELKRSGNLKALILDLRNNPGGLLESAVSICEIFVPKGSTIVTTKGRRGGSEISYKSLISPIEPNLPLAVLINSGSASASEIVAGAIQDLDRGIIIGETSFGKGLVQSVFNLPYNTNLKMTTAKYYTPSGRCIQRIEYAKKYDGNSVKEKPDTNIFYTSNGRKVLESKGIAPDSIIINENYSEFVISLLKNNFLFNFATRWSAVHDSLGINFNVNENIIKNFKEYLTSKNFNYHAVALQKIESIKSKSGYKTFSKKLQMNLDAIEKLLTSEERNQVDENSENIKKILSFEILSRFYPESKIIQQEIKNDKVVNTAISLFIQNKYSGLLASSTRGNGLKQ